jgi:hypothetical protein
MHAPAGFEPAIPERSIRSLHHRQTCIQGNTQRGLGLTDEERRAFTTWDLKLSFSKRFGVSP